MRFTEFEALGLSVAAMSEKADGDWSTDKLHTEGFTQDLPGDPREIILLRQVHTAGVVEAESAQRNSTDELLNPLSLPEGDAIVTATLGLSAAVRVADCVPIFLYEPIRQVGAIVHAGREGTLQGITANVVKTMEDRHGAQPGRIHVLLGPSAGPCCYEVSPEMANQFARKGLAHKGRLLDLWESNIGQLVQAGVPRSQVSLSAICTICDGRFHSYRASGGAKLNNIAILTI